MDDLPARAVGHDWCEGAWPAPCRPLLHLQTATGGRVGQGKRHSGNSIRQGNPIRANLPRANLPPAPKLSLSVWMCLRLKAPGYLSNHYSADWWDWCLMSQMNRAGTQRQSAHFIRQFHRRLLSCNHNTRVPCGRKIWHSTLSTFHNWWARWLHTATELRMHHPVYLQVTRQEVLDTGEVIRFHILWICAQVEITPSLLISVRMYWHSWTNETKGAQGG
jgi:hypothetical protein